MDASACSDQIRSVPASASLVRQWFSPVHCFSCPLLSRSALSSPPLLHSSHNFIYNRLYPSVHLFRFSLSPFRFKYIHCFAVAINMHTHARAPWRRPSPPHVLLTPRSSPSDSCSPRPVLRSSPARGRASFRPARPPPPRPVSSSIVVSSFVPPPQTSTLRLWRMILSLPPVLAPRIVLAWNVALYCTPLPSVTRSLSPHPLHVLLHVTTSGCRCRFLVIGDFILPVTIRSRRRH